MFTAREYAELHQIAFSPYNPGYRPTIVESPNGDGKLDTEKKYAHISMKYLNDEACSFTEEEKLDAFVYLEACRDKALEVAITLGIPKGFWPLLEHSAIRVLEYPPGAITHPHTDFDLFTLMLYRNLPNCFKYNNASSEDFWTLEDAKTLNHQIHFGEMLEIINPYYVATPHEVLADHDNRTQYSAVFFAIPDHNAVLPNGVRVGDYLEERIQRSRKEVY